MQDLRGALLGLFQEVGSDPTKPQDVARRFKLNKNLTWKVAKIVGSRDAMDAVNQIPGASGMTIFLKAMSNAGASDKAIDRVSRAMDRYEQMIEIHVGDRASLELMLDGMASDQTKLLKSRKLVYQGNTGLWGVQAQTRVTAQFIAPNAEDPTKLDTIQIAGLQHVRRLRPIPRWNVFRIGRFTLEDLVTNRAPLDPDEVDCPGLMRSFCDGPMPEIHIDEQGDGLIYELGDGPVGRTGEFSCYFGYMHRSFVNRYTASESGGRGSMFSAVSMPVRTLLFDVFVHRDLYPLVDAQVAVYGKPWSSTGSFDEHAKLPIDEPLLDLGRGANVSTPLADHYPSVITQAHEQAGWEPDDFHCLRLVVEYPPMPSAIGVSFELPKAT